MFGDQVIGICCNTFIFIQTFVYYYFCITTFIEMRSISILDALCSAAVVPAAFAASLGHFDAKTLGFTRRWDYAIQQELTSILSSSATVLSPLDDGFVNSTERYMMNVQPKVELSVQVGTEEDVATVVSSHQISKMVSKLKRLAYI